MSCYGIVVLTRGQNHYVAVVLFGNYDVQGSKSERISGRAGWYYKKMTPHREPFTLSQYLVNALKRRYIT
jgi:hypothetical protein